MGGLSDPFFDDPFFNSFISSVEWKKIFSNEEKLHVDPLPDNLEVYGDFTIKADVDKKEVMANKPVNLTITIEGEGNVDDIRKFDPEIPDAVVYADDPKVESSLQNGKYAGRFTQKIAIVSDHDFTIPAIEFTYFDSKTQQKVTKKTKPVSVKVKGAAVRQKTPVKAEASPQLKEEIKAAKTESAEPLNKAVKEDSNLKYLYLLAGTLLGSFLTYFLMQYRPYRSAKAPKPIVKMIQKAKDDKTLYNLLLPYAKEGEYLAEILQKLEENIYKGAGHTIDRNEIIDYFEEMVEQ